MCDPDERHEDFDYDQPEPEPEPEPEPDEDEGKDDALDAYWRDLRDSHHPG